MTADRTPANRRDLDAVDEAFPLIYEQLRRLAHRQLTWERSDHTLNTTALVHEAYMQLADLDPDRWSDRSHFLRTASRIMRHILVDYARRRNAQKRGGGQVRVELDEEVLAMSEEYAATLLRVWKPSVRGRVSYSSSAISVACGSRSAQKRWASPWRRYRRS